MQMNLVPNSGQMPGTWKPGRARLPVLAEVPVRKKFARDLADFVESVREDPEELLGDTAHRVAHQLGQPTIGRKVGSLYKVDGTELFQKQRYTEAEHAFSLAIRHLLAIPHTDPLPSRNPAWTVIRDEDGELSDDLWVDSMICASNAGQCAIKMGLFALVSICDSDHAGVKWLIDFEGTGLATRRAGYVFCLCLIRFRSVSCVHCKNIANVD